MIIRKKLFIELDFEAYISDNLKDGVGSNEDIAEAFKEKMYNDLAKANQTVLACDTKVEDLEP